MQIILKFKHSEFEKNQIKTVYLTLYSGQLWLCAQTWLDKFKPFKQPCMKPNYWLKRYWQFTASECFLRVLSLVGWSYFGLQTHEHMEITNFILNYILLLCLCVYPCNSSLCTPHMWTLIQRLEHIIRSPRVETVGDSELPTLGFWNWGPKLRSSIVSIHKQSAIYAGPVMYIYFQLYFITIDLWAMKWKKPIRCLF